MTADETPDQWVWLARIRRPQGRKGEVFAEILTDFPEKFAQRRRLWLLTEPVAPASQTNPIRSAPLASSSPREVQLTHHWLHKGGVVLHFADVHSISDAEALAGHIVAVPRAERAALAPGEVYIADLIGCVLVDVRSAESGRPPLQVGVIEDVERAVSPVPLLIVRGASGEVLIPFAHSYLRKIDLDARRVEMALPDGLVDLNA